MTACRSSRHALDPRRAPALSSSSSSQRVEVWLLALQRSDAAARALIAGTSRPVPAGAAGCLSVDRWRTSTHASRALRAVCSVFWMASNSPSPSTSTSASWISDGLSNTAPSSEYGSSGRWDADGGVPAQAPRRAVARRPSAGTMPRCPRARASSSHRRSTVTVPQPSTANSARTAQGCGRWRQRQPSFQTAERPSQRLLPPVSSTSRPSAKLDLPEPLRPTTSVRPGPGGRFSVAAGPMPRKPSTVMALQVGAGRFGGGLGLRRCQRARGRCLTAVEDGGEFRGAFAGGEHEVAPRVGVVAVGDESVEDEWGEGARSGGGRHWRRSLSHWSPAP